MGTLIFNRSERRFSTAPSSVRPGSDWPDWSGCQNLPPPSASSPRTKQSARIPQRCRSIHRVPVKNGVQFNPSLHVHIRIPFPTNYSSVPRASASRIVGFRSTCRRCYYPVLFLTGLFYLGHAVGYSMVSYVSCIVGAW